MRILFLGTTGTKKSDLLMSIRGLAHKSAVEDGEIAGNSRPEELVRILSLEETIKRGTPVQKAVGNLSTYLDAPEKTRRALWRGAMEEILAEIESSESTGHIFLELHGFYWRRRQLFSDWEWNLLARFNPDLLITLTDDMYDVQNRILKGDPKEHYRNKLLLREISAWRSAELALGDMFSKGLRADPEKFFGIGPEAQAKYTQVCQALEDIDQQLPSQMFGSSIANYLVPVKHSPALLHNLIFHEKGRAVYTSFSISHVRSKREDVMPEIDSFRKRIVRDFIVFDPISIDEYVLTDRDSEGKKLSSDELLRKYPDTYSYQKLRWPFGSVSAVSGEEDTTISGPEYVDVIEDIKGQIAERDFRLIDQVGELGGIVVAYRPLLEGHEAGGVREEIRHAIDAAIPVFYFHPPEDREKSKAHGPLDSYNRCLGPYETEDALVKAMMDHFDNI